MTAKLDGNMTSLEKALYLLFLFAEEPYEYTVPELVEMTGLNRTTIYRNIVTLEESGLLIRNERGKSYKLGPMAYHMGSVYLQNANYEENILNILESIAKESRESVGLARREGNRVVSIYSVEIHQPVKMNDKPGEFYPMNTGTYGKCLMAYHDQKTVGKLFDQYAPFEKLSKNTITDKADLLEEYRKIREDGFVTSIEESFPLVIGIGIPLTGSTGDVRNVVSISFFKEENYLEKMEALKDLLFRYKKELEKYIV
jgi:DNA-binding IclR family transcriptional regulator